MFFSQVSKFYVIQYEVDFPMYYIVGTRTFFLKILHSGNREGFKILLLRTTLIIGTTLVIDTKNYENSQW